MTTGARRVSRRTWLAGAAGTFAGLAAGFPAGFGTHAATHDEPKPAPEPPIGTNSRRDRAYWVREQVARAQREQAAEETIEPAAVSPAFFQKGLVHANDGSCQSADVAALYTAARSPDLQAMEDLTLAAERRMKNPMGGASYSLWGSDPCLAVIPPPPALDSARAAEEAVELYWLALARDLPFTTWHGEEIIAAAAAELTQMETFASLRGEASLNNVTIFRDAIAGTLHGPFISQFIWKPFQAGANLVHQRIRTYQPGFDYLTTWDDWLHCQQGLFSRAAATSSLKFVHTLRDLAAYVHRDVGYQLFNQAAHVLFDFGPTLDPDDYDLPYDPGHPYRYSRKQCAFGSLGPPQVLELMAVAGTLALRSAWWQKWNTHPFLRPEEYGGIVHRALADIPGPPAISPVVLKSEAVRRIFEKNGSYLLPGAYPEGCPMHPAYPSGHAAISGACVTILKALFDESYVITRPVVATEDGLNLASYEGPELTLGGELDKLAWNVALGRLAAGIHWRSDGHWGLRLGEQIGLAVLRDWKATVAEGPFSLSLTTFDGEQITV